LARLGALISDSAILEEALQVIRQALAISAVTEVNFNVLQAHVELARTLFELGGRSENLDRLMEAKQLTVMVRSWYQDAGAPQDDSYFVDQLAKIEPEITRLSARRQAAFDLGVSLEKQNRPKEAEAVYREGLELGDGFLASCLGVLLNKQGRAEGGRSRVS
jgi:tetratricopeptide (TPR) repeat protein